MRGENRHFDTVLMGRKTYEPGLKVGLSSPCPTLKQYVFSTTMEESPHEDVTLVSEDAAGLIRKLKMGPGKDVWLAGDAGREPLLGGPRRRVDPQNEPGRARASHSSPGTSTAPAWTLRMVRRTAAGSPCYVIG